MNQPLLARRTVPVAVATLVASLLISTGAGAQTLEPWRNYDSFGGGLIDLAKWQNSERTRVIRGGRLDMSQRQAGLNASDSGATFSGWGENFVNPANVTAMRAKVTVNAVDVPPCAANSWATFGRARVIGGFFNIGVPTPGSRVGDFIAQVRIGRFSNTTDAPGVLRVQSLMSICNVSDCSTGTLVGPVHDLGTISLGQSAQLQLQWDRAAKTFLVSRDSGAATAAMTYLEDDSNPPQTPFKLLDTRLDLPQCSAGPVVAAVDASFDNVAVNRSAVP